MNVCPLRPPVRVSSGWTEGLGGQSFRMIGGVAIPRCAGAGGDMVELLNLVENLLGDTQGDTLAVTDYFWSRLR